MSTCVAGEAEIDMSTSQMSTSREMSNFSDDMSSSVKIISFVICLVVWKWIRALGRISETKLHRAKFREAKLRTKLRLETLALPTRNETSRNFTEILPFPR